MTRLPIGCQALPDQPAHKHPQSSASLDWQILPPQGARFLAHLASPSSGPGTEEPDDPRAASTEPLLQRFPGYMISTGLSWGEADGSGSSVMVSGPRKARASCQPA